MSCLLTLLESDAPTGRSGGRWCGCWCGGWCWCSSPGHIKFSMQYEHNGTHLPLVLVRVPVLAILRCGCWCWCWCFCGAGVLVNGAVGPHKGIMNKINPGFRRINKCHVGTANKPPTSMHHPHPAPTENFANSRRSGIFSAAALAQLPISHGPSRPHGLGRGF